MPNLPPFSRSESIRDYVKECGGVNWREDRVRGIDGVEVALAVAGGEERLMGKVGEDEEGEGEVQAMREEGVVRKEEGKRICVLYFQGNGGSVPPRLPVLSSVLKALYQQRSPGASMTRYTLVALSYRGYWSSHGRPSERGIGLDAQAAIQYAVTHHSPDHLILWGQSLGASVATAAAAALLCGRNDTTSSTNRGMSGERPSISGLLLETPFVSIRAMLLALYPQKWLPYRYLGAFLWNHWDSRVALHSFAEVEGEGSKPKVLILQAGQDELVPVAQGEELEETCTESKINVQKKLVSGALHNDVMAKKAGRREIVEFIKGFG
ncbi:MAG: hypothetical protein Q9218_002496 [Villophora microphyllina]